MRKVNTLNPPSGNPPRASFAFSLQKQKFPKPSTGKASFSKALHGLVFLLVFNFFLLLEGSKRAFSSCFRGPKPSKPHLDQLKSQNELTFPKNVPGSTRPTGKKRHNEQLLPPCRILGRHGKHPCLRPKMKTGFMGSNLAFSSCFKGFLKAANWFFPAVSVVPGSQNNIWTS